MKKSTKKDSKKRKSKKYAKIEDVKGQVYCSLPKVPERKFKDNVGPNRMFAIQVIEKKWVNGTTLHYYFFDKENDGQYVYDNIGNKKWYPWTSSKSQKDVVRDGFKVWEDIGIGIKFEEVNNREDAEIRIGFMMGDGHWSYVGRDILDQGVNKRTMNFGQNMIGLIDTAVHEIGHTLGLPHEHQNPNAGILWDEEAVYNELAGPPNNWPRSVTYHNIIRKIDPDTVQGSNWDPNSIMHYRFEPGLILKPEQYSTGLTPAPGLSERDKTWVKTFYPPLDDDNIKELKPLKSQELQIEEGEQVDFVIKPKSTRYYNFGTFGISDTVMVLFEDIDGEMDYRTADDDSGEDYNAYIRTKLIKNHKYIIRIRLYYNDEAGNTAIMMW